MQETGSEDTGRVVPKGRQVDLDRGSRLVLARKISREIGAGKISSY